MGTIAVIILKIILLAKHIGYRLLVYMQHGGGRDRESFFGYRETKIIFLNKDMWT